MADIKTINLPNEINTNYVHTTSGSSSGSDGYTIDTTTTSGDYLIYNPLVSDGTSIQIDPNTTWTTTISSDYTIHLTEGTKISIKDKEYDISKLLGLLLNAYLPVSVDGDKVKLVKVAEMLDKVEGVVP